MYWVALDILSSPISVDDIYEESCDLCDSNILPEREFQSRGSKNMSLFSPILTSTVGAISIVSYTIAVVVIVK